MAKHAVAYDELIAFAAGDLAGPRRDDIAHHLAGCPACARTVAAYQVARDVVRTDTALAPSPSVLTRLKNLMTPESPAEPTPQPLGRTIRRVIATLVFDGRQPLAAAGLRGSSGAHTLVYTAAGVDVDLQLEPPATGSEHWLITGQISLPGDHVRADVELASSPPSATVSRTAVDETGLFSVSVESGVYDLLVRLPNEEILVPGIDLA